MPRPADSRNRFAQGLFTPLPGRYERLGVALTEHMLREGRPGVAAAGMAPRIALVGGRAEQLPFPDASFDALTFTYLLRYVDDPQATLTELARVGKAGGTMARLEVCVPL